MLVLVALLQAGLLACAPVATQPDSDREAAPLPIVAAGPDAETDSIIVEPTSFPAIGPTPDSEATKAAIEAADAYRRHVELATRSAVEAQQEAERYAAALEATRVAELPTPTLLPTTTPLATATPVPTARPLPTSTPVPTRMPTPTATLAPTATPTVTTAPTPVPTATPFPWLPQTVEAQSFAKACEEGSLPVLPSNTLGTIRFPEGSMWGVGAVAGMLVGGTYSDDSIFDSNGISPGGFFGPVLGFGHDFERDGVAITCVTVMPGYTIEFLTHPDAVSFSPPQVLHEGNSVIGVDAVQKFRLRATGLLNNGKVVVRILEYQRCVGSAVC